MKIEAARPIKAEKHLWYVYNGRKPVTLTDTKGQKLSLKKGDIYGLFNLTNRIDRIALPARPDIRYFVKVEESSDILDDSKRHREPVEFAVIPKTVKPKRVAAPKPVKAAKPARVVKIPTVADIAKSIAEKRKATKPKRDTFELDEDTFADYGDFGDFDM